MRKINIHPPPSGLEEKATFLKYIAGNLIPRQEHVTISQGERWKGSYVGSQQCVLRPTLGGFECVDLCGVRSGWTAEVWSKDSQEEQTEIEIAVDTRSPVRLVIKRTVEISKKALEDSKILLGTCLKGNWNKFLAGNLAAYVKCIKFSYSFWLLRNTTFKSLR